MPIMKKKTRRTSTHKQEEMSVTLFAQAQAKNRSMRPLTAYYIFFQIGRESIIQITAGSTSNAEESEKRLLRKSSSL